jgi:8-oxo-dGTP diphosphatase
MDNAREILKIGLAVTQADRLLVLKKKGAPSYILPGGKPEAGEDDARTLEREIQEELGCQLKVGSLVFLGAFSDAAADMPNTTVTVKLYAAELEGTPNPQAEIEKLEWLSPHHDTRVVLAPSLQKQIVPFLYASGLLR